MENQATAFHHTEAARILGVSPATLRRLAKFYEDAFELLPTDAKGGRIYPDHALKRVQAARVLFDEGRAANLETAFTLLARGTTGSPDEVLFQASTPAPIDQLLVEFKGMRRALEHMSERIDVLQDENNHLHEQVLKQLENPSERSSSEFEVLQINRYLLGELERRSRVEFEATRRRPWWRWWSL